MERAKEISEVERMVIDSSILNIDDDMVSGLKYIYYFIVTRFRIPQRTDQMLQQACLHLEKYTKAKTLLFGVKVGLKSYLRLPYKNWILDQFP